MNDSIRKKLELLAEWKDRGMRRGLKDTQRNAEQLKKRIRSVTKTAVFMGAAFVAATAALFAFIRQGSEVLSIKESFEGFLKIAKMGPELLEDITEATRGTVAGFDLMKSSVMALGQGLSPQRLVQFWGMAKQVADVMSVDVNEAFFRLTGGFLKMETELLKGIGMVIRMDDAYEKYAKTIGKVRSELTKAEQKQAYYVAIYDLYIKQFYSVGDVTNRTRERFQQLTSELKNSRDSFSEIIAESPAVMEFLGFIRDKLNEINQALERNEGQIQGVVGRMIVLIERSITLAELLWKNKEAVLALGLGLTVLAKTGNPAAAALTALATAAILTFKTITHAAIDLGVKIYSTLIDFNNQWLGALADAAEKVPWIGGELAAGLKNEIQKGLDIKDWIIEWGEINKELLDKYAPPNLLLNLLRGKPLPKIPIPPMPPEIRAPGGLEEWTPPPEEGSQRMALTKEQLKIITEAEDENYNLRNDLAEQHYDYLVGLEEARHGRYLDIWASEQFSFTKDLLDRRAAYMKAYQAMGQYSAAFYKKGAHMGRALNAMAIAGFSEMAASYIESKIAQAKIDAFEYAYKAIAAAAGGNWFAVGPFMLASAKAAALAGVGTLAAGAIRSWGQEKAEALTAEAEEPWGEYEEEDTGEMRRRTAAGVVQQRPVSITVMSTTRIQAGLIVFPDGSEAAAEQFYTTYTRDQIQADIEAGVIAIP